MALSIKNAETERLARALAAATGESVTSAVTVALRLRLDEITPDHRRDRVFAALTRISADTASRWPAAVRDLDHGELLYDDQGLPR